MTEKVVKVSDLIRILKSKKVMDAHNEFCKTIKEICGCGGNCRQCFIDWFLQIVKNAEESDRTERNEVTQLERERFWEGK